MPGLIHGLEPAKIAANLERVREHAGPGVEILAAIKYLPLEELGALAEAGVELVGENRQQDLEAKHERWGDAFEWDFIGNLQSRKVKRLLPICRLVHSVASDSALEQLGRHGDAGTEVLVEVNVAGERGKGGDRPRAARRVHRALPRPRLRPDDDAPLQHRPRGLPPAFRQAGRAGGGARPPPPLDGNLAGLACGRRGGGHDHPPWHCALCLIAIIPGGIVNREPNDPEMALKDTWHKALVYFGLAEEHDYGPEYDEEFPETSEEEIEARRESGQVRRLPTSRRSRRDEIDDIFADDEPISASRTRTLRPVDGDSDVKVHLVIPRNFNDAQQVADQFKRSVPVILNLQTTDHELSKRMIDFCSGLTYSLDGGMQRIAEKIFLLTPRNVEVSAEEKARLLDKGFFNQS